MTERFRIPLVTQINRRILRVIFRGIFRLLGKVKIQGMDNVPDHNRYVVAFNHVSLVEVPFILAYWPTVIEVLGAAAVWERPGQSLLARLYKGIQLKRTEYDRAVFEQIKKVIEAGRPLMISPEGGRSHSPGLQRGKPGVAYIVDQTQTPVLPVAVVGATMDFLSNGLRGKKPSIEMRVGKLFHLPPLTGKGEERRRSRQHNADIIMARVAELLPESYRGVYSDFEIILNGKYLVVE